MDAPRPAVLVLGFLVVVHLTLETADHLHDHGLYEWQTLGLFEVLLAVSELVLVERVTRGVRDEARCHRRTRRRVQAVLAGCSITTAMQPIYDLDSGLVVGVEALSRFPDDPSIPPDAWFSDAHRTGDGLALELLAVRLALGRAICLPDVVYLSVNVSPSTLAHPQLLETILNSPIDPSRVVIELTEHAVVADYPMLDIAIQPLRRHRVRLAVDDACAGYSSLRHVVDLRPDIVKIDRSLISDVDQDCGRRALIEATVHLARELGITVIGEGVETRAELAVLRELGVERGQGYLLGKPTENSLEWGRWAALAALTPP